MDYLVLWTDKVGRKSIVWQASDLKEAQKFCVESKLPGDLTIYKVRESYQN